MASIYVDNHLAGSMKNQEVVTLLSERKGPLREQIVKNINIRVNQAHREKEFANMTCMMENKAKVTMVHLQM
eukprot:8662310-Karenia_brevis.AAC.1